MSRTRKIVPRTCQGTRGKPQYTANYRVYIACPKSEYWSPRYNSMIKDVQQHYPGALLVEPAQLFDSLQDWRSRCPQVLEKIAELVFFTTPDGWIGRGVYTEIQAAIRHRKPVQLLTSDGRLAPFEHVVFLDLDQQNWTRYCRVSLTAEAKE
jgi:hypothetical protein